MRYEEFKARVKGSPIISGQYLKLVAAGSQAFKNQLMRWQVSSKIIKLKRSLYILNEEDRKINPSRLFIASELYRPSYISMEYALALYGLIPEKVADITSITSKKTVTYKNFFGVFTYQHIKINAFTGFVERLDEAGLVYYMALPEKAFVDYIYLNKDKFRADFKNVLTESMRFQNLKSLDTKKLLGYARLFENKKLDAILKEVLI